MKRFSPLLCLLLLLGGGLPASACTSFAVYSGEPVYGMNFDYPEVEVRLAIDSAGDRRIFQMYFLLDGNFTPTVGMNDDGLFTSCQLLYPELPFRERSSDREIYTWELYRSALWDHSSVEEVSEFLADRRLLHWTVSVHDLIADSRGDAMVVEPGPRGNLLTRKEQEFLVMTNFPNAAFPGLGPEEVRGVGADRYQIAHRSIQENLEGFGLDQAMETLERAAMEGPFRTLCSMVFFPERGEVYVAFDRDYGKIWRVSIREGTIETYRGFRQSRRMALDSSGVLASDLVLARSKFGMLWIMGGLILLAAAGGALIVFVRQRPH